MYTLQKAGHAAAAFNFPVDGIGLMRDAQRGPRGVYVICTLRTRQVGVANNSKVQRCSCSHGCDFLPHAIDIEASPGHFAILAGCLRRTIGRSYARKARRGRRNQSSEGSKESKMSTQQLQNEMCEQMPDIPDVLSFQQHSRKAEPNRPRSEQGSKI